MTCFFATNKGIALQRLHALSRVAELLVEHHSLYSSCPQHAPTRRIAQRRLLVLLVSITEGNNARHEITLRTTDQITNVATVETLHDARAETVGLAGEHEHLQREHGLLDAPFLDIRCRIDDDSVGVVLGGPRLVRPVLQSALYQKALEIVLAAAQVEGLDEIVKLGFRHSLLSVQLLHIVSQESGLYS